MDERCSKVILVFDFYKRSLDSMINFRDSMVFIETIERKINYIVP